MAGNIQQSSITISQQLLYAVKTGSHPAELIKQVQQLDEDTLLKELDTDDAKKAFWLNIYNAFVQQSLQTNPGQYQSRRSFFSKKFIGIAGRHISLDTIEHGILRRSRHKWSLGYLRHPFPPAFEKKHWVSTIDYRIHFALNCGAASCPPIAFYNPGIVNQQLDIATAGYLGTEAAYNAYENKVQLPALFSWFRADFGGTSGIKNILVKHHVIPAAAAKGLRISFKKYNWALALNAWKDG
jgi:Protein of unknown function, DUF547